MKSRARASSSAPLRPPSAPGTGSCLGSTREPRQRRAEHGTSCGHPWGWHRWGTPHPALRGAPHRPSLPHLLGLGAQRVVGDAPRLPVLQAGEARGLCVPGGRRAAGGGGSTEMGGPLPRGLRHSGGIRPPDPRSQIPQGGSGWAMGATGYCWGQWGSLPSVLPCPRCCWGARTP